MIPDRNVYANYSESENIHQKLLKLQMTHLNDKDVQVHLSKKGLRSYDLRDNIFHRYFAQAPFCMRTFVPAKTCLPTNNTKNFLHRQ